jgi:alpha/beta superfamily hydrolase
MGLLAVILIATIPAVYLRQAIKKGGFGREIERGRLLPVISRAVLSAVPCSAFTLFAALFATMSDNSADLPAPGQSRQLLIDGPAGRLETLLAVPRQDTPAGICVVCHPHPLMGGAMSNKVVYTLASSALQAGLLTARFNFRGVGRSEGSYDQARGETDDALAVVAWLRRRQPQAPLVLAGFSFGAFVSLKAAAAAHPALQISVSIPFGKYVENADPPPNPGCPWLAVHSVDDDVVSYEDTLAVLQAYTPPPQLARFENAGHFYHGRLVELQQIVLPFLQQHLPV